VQRGDIMKLRINKKAVASVLLSTIILFSGCGVIKNIKADKPVMEGHTITSTDIKSGEVVKEPVLEEKEEVVVTKLLFGYEYVDMSNPGITTSSVNFRKGPSTDYEIIETLDNDVKVELLAKTSNDWYMINYNGNKGFLSADYVKEIDYNKTREQMNNIPNLVKGIEATTGLNVRTNPNTDSQVITTIHAGDRLKMNSRLDNGWYEVMINDEIGYVSGDYVNEVYILDGDWSKMVYMKEDANLVDEPYGNTTTKIPYLEIGYVYGETDDYYFIESNGNLGYVPKSCVGSLHDVYVVVDISDQVLKLYNGNELLLTSDVVSGKNETPSDYGIFNIYSMSRNATLTGPGYSCPVDYWMPYNGGEGLHDAQWRYSFGGDIYEYGGSHGCINLPLNTAATIYDNASVGTQVLIKK
jgi:uncharacterized protein YgiM (DUF1202 family)